MDTMSLAVMFLWTQHFGADPGPNCCTSCQTNNHLLEKTLAVCVT